MALMGLKMVVAIVAAIIAGRCMWVSVLESRILLFFVAASCAMSTYRLVREILDWLIR